MAMRGSPRRIAVAEARDGDGAIVFANQRFRDFVLRGADPNTVSVLTCLQLSAPQIHLASGNTEEHSLQRQLESHPDKPWVEICISPVEAEPGVVLVEVLDVTARVQAEAALERVEQEARAIYKAYMARAELAVSEYMAHEICSPAASALAGVSFMTDYFAQAGALGSDDGSLQGVFKDLKTVSAGVESVVGLVESLSDFGRLHAGTLPSEPRDVNVAQGIVEPVANELRRRCPPGISCSVECSPGLEGRCDAIRLRKVLLNLAGNALRFTKRGSVCLKVSSEGGNLVACVSDTGAGIRAAAAARLCRKPFSAAPGHGQSDSVALHLAHALVNELGGRLWLDPAYDSGVEDSPGARFCVRVPWAARPPLHKQCRGRTSPPALADSKVAKEEEQAAEEHLDALQSESKESTRRLLLVDDDEMVRMMMLRILGKAAPEFAVTEAATAEEAIKIVRCGASFDAIIMDQHMTSSGGELLGTEAVRTLRDMGVGALIVGFSGNDLAQEYADAGAGLTWRKPMTCRQTIRKDLLSRRA